MENEELIKQYIDALDVSLDELEPAIKNLSAKSFEDRINETSDEHEKIKIANGSYTNEKIAYLKARGIDTNKHPISKDLARVKSYMNRAKEAKEPKKESKVDTGAAKRFIEAALNNGTGNSTVIKGTPEPAISSASFQGKHTKFEEPKDQSDNEKELNQTAKIRKQSQKTQTGDKVKKPKKNKKSTK